MQWFNLKISCSRNLETRNFLQGHFTPFTHPLSEVYHESVRKMGDYPSKNHIVCSDRRTDREKESDDPADYSYIEFRAQQLQTGSSDNKIIYKYDILIFKKKIRARKVNNIPFKSYLYHRIITIVTC